MKHNALTALSLAAALVVAGSAGATPFSVTFDEAGYAIDAAHAWDTPSQDAATIVTTNGIDNSSTKALLLDTGDDELSYTNDFSGVQVLTMDVCFVAADAAPATNGFTGKTMVYLHDTGSGYELRAYALGGNDWVTLNPSGVTFAPDTWYKLTMEFSGTTVTYSINDTPAGTATLASSFDSVQSVGFKGTGLVDNFAGTAAGIPGATDDGTGESSAAAATINGNVVTGHFETKLNGDDLKFIRVFDSSENYVTLRYSNSQAITLPAGFTPAKVVAYYGDDVSATTGITPEATDVAVDNGTVTVTFTAKSGVYYWLKDVSDGVSGNISLDGTATAIAPNAEGEITLTFTADSNAWGVKKFQLVVDDNPPPAAASGN